MNIHLQDVHVTLVISPTDLRCGYHRLHSIAQDQLGINLNDGKEAVVFISKTRRDFSQVCERSSQWCELRYSQVQTAH